MEYQYTFWDYVRQFREGEVLTRYQVADLMGVHYSTARYHLDRAVKAGYLNRNYFSSGTNQTVVGYALPSTMPRFENIDSTQSPA